MLLESDKFDLTDVNLLTADVGGMAVAFLDSITEANATRLVNGYNLIKVTDPDTMLGSIVTDILVDQSVDIPLQKDTLLRLMLTNIIKLLRQASVHIDEDNVEFSDYDTIYQILDLFTIVDNIEDLMGLSIVLENQSISPKERFIQLYSTIYIEEDESVLERLHILIKDVSEVTLETLRLSLIYPKLEDIIPDKLVQRICANKDLLCKSFVGDFIRNGGNVGSTVENLLSFFSTDLNLLRDPDYEFPLHYYVAVLGVIIISDTNNESIRSVFAKFAESTVEDVDLLMDIDKLLDGVVYE